MPSGEDSQRRLAGLERTMRPRAGSRTGRSGASRGLINRLRPPLVALECIECGAREAWYEGREDDEGADPDWCPSCHHEGPRIGCCEKEEAAEQ